MTLISYNEGPLVSVFFHTNSSQIQRIKLTDSSCFTVEISADADSNLKTLILNWVQHYLRKEPLPSLPLDFSDISLFQKKVLIQLLNTCTILSYKQLAALAESPQASRAVGTACKHNPFPLVIPCHRVIRSDRTLGEYNGGVFLKERLLSFEGHIY